MKILMVGLGGAGQRHLRILRENLGDRAEIFAYRVRGKKSVLTPGFQIDPSADLEEKYHLRAFTKLEDALNQEPELAFICNPSSLHIPVALDLAEAGCHLFIEKPLSHNWEGVERLVEVCLRKNLTTMVAYQMRFHPCLQWMHSHLEAGRLGRILSARIEVGSFLPSWHPYEDYRDLYAARKDLGGGVLLTEIHEMDYAYWFFDLPKRIFTIGGNLGTYDMDVENTVSLLWECGGANGTFPVHLNMCMVQRPPRRSCEIHGERGALIWDGDSEVRFYDAEGDVWEKKSFPGFERSQMFAQEVRCFLDCVQNGTKPIVDVASGAESLRIALAAKESLETGNPVELEAKALCKR